MADVVGKVRAVLAGNSQVTAEHFIDEVEHGGFCEVWKVVFLAEVHQGYASRGLRANFRQKPPGLLVRQVPSST